MKLLRNVCVFIVLSAIFLLLMGIEMNTILPHLNIGYSVLLVLTNIIFYSFALILFVNRCLSTNSDTPNNINRKKYAHKTISNNPPTIIPKSLGGYNREQLNEIYLIGILIHQIYMSDMRCNLSERQQRKSLSIQMRFFVTVFPQRDVAEYFDFSEQFISKNEHLASLSIDECIAQSAQRLSDCNNKQIEKLRNLFKTLGTAYKEQVGGGSSKMITAFLNLLDAELSNLKTEEDWRDSYAKKKTH